MPCQPCSPESRRGTGAAAGRVADRDRAAVQLDDAPRDREPEARAARLAGEERLEDRARGRPRGRPGRWSLTSMTSRPPSPRDPRASPGAPGRERVVDQVHERPARMRARVERPRRAARRGIDRDSPSTRLRGARARAPPGRPARARARRCARTRADRCVSFSSRTASSTTRSAFARGLLAARQHLGEQLRVALERRERVADLVREHRRHLAEAREPALALARAAPRRAGAARAAPARSRRRAGSAPRARRSRACASPRRAARRPATGSNSITMRSAPAAGRSSVPAAEAELDAHAPAQPRGARTARAAVALRVADRRARLGDDLAVAVDHRDVAQALIGMISQDLREVRLARRAVELAEVRAHRLLDRETLPSRSASDASTTASRVDHVVATSAAAISANAMASGGTRRRHVGAAGAGESGIVGSIRRHTAGAPATARHPCRRRRSPARRCRCRAARRSRGGASGRGRSARGASACPRPA